MSKLDDLTSSVNQRLLEEMDRLRLTGATFERDTGISNQVFSNVSIRRNNAKSGFISALCTHYQADASYIITGVRSAPASNTATANGYKSKAVAGDRSMIQEVKTDDKEVVYLKEMLKAREREIADKLSIIAEKERLIQVLMGKTCTPCDTEKENE